MCEITLLSLLYSLIVQEEEKGSETLVQGLPVRYFYIAMRSKFFSNTPGNHIAGHSEVVESLLKSKPLNGLYDCTRITNG